MIIPSLPPLKKIIHQNSLGKISGSLQVGNTARIIFHIPWNHPPPFEKSSEFPHGVHNNYSVSWRNGKFPTPSTFVNDLKLPY